MKKLHLTLIALFLLFAAQAQTITEKDLLGQWGIISFTVGGLGIDFETGKVTLSDEALKKLEGQDIEALKTKMAPALELYRNGTMTFSPGNKMEFVIGDKHLTNSYVLTTNEGKQYLRDNSTNSVSTVSLTEGLLKINTIKKNAEVIMYLRKKETL